MKGGYDDGYEACECFWGKEPGSLVRQLAFLVPQMSGLSVLDAGCGEGKNAAFLAERGATVTAIDVSSLAIAHGRRTWPDLPIRYEVQAVGSLTLPREAFDVVIMYGLLHCLKDEEEIRATVENLQAATVRGGYNVLCAFNDRHHNLSAHPTFTPTLVAHDRYVGLYRDWTVLHASDTDLFETHPHNNIPHVHSMTRVLAQKG
jgi:tellurite methyltransferase